MTATTTCTAQRLSRPSIPSSSPLRDVKAVLPGRILLFGCRRCGPACKDDISKWDVSQITTMEHLFKGQFEFNQPIGDWDTYKVTKTWRNVPGEGFNQPIGDWPTSQVTNAKNMFTFASEFNQPVGDWDTSEGDEHEWDVCLGRLF